MCVKNVDVAYFFIETIVFDKLEKKFNWHLLIFSSVPTQHDKIHFNFKSSMNKRFIWNICKISFQFFFGNISFQKLLLDENYKSLYFNNNYNVMRKRDKAI